MIFTNILLNKFLDFSNEETIHLANAIEVIWMATFHRGSFYLL